MRSIGRGKKTVRGVKMDLIEINGILLPLWVKWVKRGEMIAGWTIYNIYTIWVYGELFQVSREYILYTWT